MLNIETDTGCNLSAARRFTKYASAKLRLNFLQPRKHHSIQGTFKLMILFYGRESHSTKELTHT